MDTLTILLFAFAGGAGVVWYLGRLFKRSREEVVIVSRTIADRVRSVGKIVGLEVAAKEIVTTTSGWPWMPPLLLSQARLAMIFQFEKQYFVDLSRVSEGDVELVGAEKYVLKMPPIEGVLRLVDVVPYDIQAGRVLGLLDVIPMTASRQQALMAAAQTQASKMIEAGDERYVRDARASVERHVRTLLGLFGVEVEVVWPEGEESSPRRRGVRGEEAGAESAEDSARPLVAV